MFTHNYYATMSASYSFNTPEGCNYRSYLNVMMLLDCESGMRFPVKNYTHRQPFYRI